MGHHTFEISLNSYLFNQCPTSIGIRLKTERSTEHPTLPKQAVGSCNLQRPLHGLYTLGGLQRRFNCGVDTTGPVAHLGPFRDDRTLRSPNLPVVGMGHRYRHPQRSPALSEALRRFETRKRASDPRLAGAAVRQAIAATRGRLLSRAGRPISAVYHATNGGVMAAGPEAWAMQPQPYLVAKIDGDEGWRERHAVPLQRPQHVSSLLMDRSGAYGSQHPLFRWSRVITADDIRQAIGAPAQALQSPLRLNALQRGASGRVLALQIAGSGESEPVVLRLDQIRRTLRRLPSTLFVIEPQGSDRWLIRGGGFGHGAGLSQAGAIDLAWRGWPTERILSHYYPGTVYGPLPARVQSP